MQQVAINSDLKKTDSKKQEEDAEFLRRLKQRQVDAGEA